MGGPTGNGYSHNIKGQYGTFISVFNILMLMSVFIIHSAGRRGGG